MTDDLEFKIHNDFKIVLVKKNIRNQRGVLVMKPYKTINIIR